MEKLVGLEGIILVIDMIKMKKMINVRGNRFLYVLIGSYFLMLLSCNIALGSPVKKVVDKYCQLDFDGARVSANDYEKIRSLMSWEEDQVEPGWDCAKIISGYRIISEKIDIDEAVVTVKFNVLADLCSDFIIYKKNYSDVVNVKLTKLNNTWKIKEYIVFPRISTNTAIKHLQNLLDNLSNDSLSNKEEISKLQLLINDLESLK